MAKDRYHDTVIVALQKDGWTITQDPLRIQPRSRGNTIQIDLGAEKIIAATKANKEIAVEVKNFIGVSDLHSFYKAVGQYLYYRTVLQNVKSKRQLFLAIPDYIYEEFFETSLPNKTLADNNIYLITYNIKSQTITSWKK